MISFAISTEQAQPHPEVQGQPIRDVPVVLEVRFHDLVAVVVLDRCILLSERSDVPQKEIGKRVSRGSGRTARIKSKVARKGARSKFPTQFVLLGCGYVGSKLQVMLAHDLINVIPEGVSRIGVVDAIGNVAGILTKASVVGAPLIDQINAGQNASVRARENSPES